MKKYILQKRQVYRFSKLRLKFKPNFDVSTFTSDYIKRVLKAAKNKQTNNFDNLAVFSLLNQAC